MEDLHIVLFDFLRAFPVNGQRISSFLPRQKRRAGSLPWILEGSHLPLFLQEFQSILPALPPVRFAFLFMFPLHFKYTCREQPHRCHIMAQIFVIVMSRRISKMVFPEPCHHLPAYPRRRNTGIGTTGQKQYRAVDILDFYICFRVMRLHQLILIHKAHIKLMPF